LKKNVGAGGFTSKRHRFHAEGTSSCFYTIKYSLKMKSAGIYSLQKKKKYLIYRLARIQMGGSIPVEPFIWLDISTPIHEVAEQIRLAFARENVVLPNPTNWHSHAKTFLAKIGLKSEKELYGGHTKYVHLGLDKDILTLSPSCNLGNGGFTNIKNKSISIPDDSALDEIGEALNKAFELCE
jgi:hypothetical protein